jgi:hypothetical protein
LDHCGRPYPNEVPKTKGVCHEGAKLRIVNNPRESDVDGFLREVSGFTADHMPQHLLGLREYGRKIHYSDGSDAWTAFAAQQGFLPHLVETTHHADG